METSIKEKQRNRRNTNPTRLFHFFRSEVWMPSCILRIGVHNCFLAKEWKNQNAKIEFDIRDCRNCQWVQGWWWLNPRWGHSDASRCLSFSRFLMLKNPVREQKHSRQFFDSRDAKSSHAGRSTPLKGQSGTKIEIEKFQRWSDFPSPRRWVFRIWVSWKRRRRWRTAAASWWSVALCLERPMVLCWKDATCM